MKAPMNSSITPPTIQFDNVTIAFDEHTILNDISVTLSERRIAIIGANGSGKSTFVRMVNGLGTPDNGKITVNGLNPQTNGRDVRKKVGFVFSDAENQILMPTVYEDVEFSLRNIRADGHRLSRHDKNNRVMAMLSRFGLDQRAHASPYRLSGGEKQMLALAAVLIAQPLTIIADEPTTLLDLSNRLKLGRLFDSLPQQLIVATHDLDFVSHYDRALWIDGGRIRADGPANEVCRTYKEAMHARDQA